MSQFTPKEVVSKLGKILLSENIRPALIFLNHLSIHRFSALYLYEAQGQLMKSIYFYDRENPAMHFSPDVPATATYCMFAMTSQRNFNVTDSLSDPRLHDHVAREVVQAYCGIPLFNRSGLAIGTVCHFSLVPTDASDDDVYYLQSFSGLLLQHGLLDKAS